MLLRYWQDIKVVDGKYDYPPEYNKVVLAVLKGCETGKEVEYEMIYVNEDDCCWRTADDNSELSYAWDVIKWKYV